jgi:hypothetical protein
VIDWTRANVPGDHGVSALISDAWLRATPQMSMDFMRQYSAENLKMVVAQPIPPAGAD